MHLFDEFCGNVFDRQAEQVVDLACCDDDANADGGEYRKVWGS
ncbi:hypothetical protein [Sulfitobacter undariae]|nr:hypothetical protein [Sulfitobacter undariae]